MNGIFTSLTANMSALIRKDKLEGKEVYVVPVVMMTQGVHNGSAGPVLYLNEDFEKSVESWNHKPVVVYHPELYGKPTSACNKEILENQKVGILLNTKYEDNKLKSEIWLDVEKTKKVDVRILDMLQNNQMIEVSTGLFTDDIEKEGKWNNEKYNKIAVNYRPDHLALLPDEKGACSIEDGAGAPRINKDFSSNQNADEYVVIGKGIYKKVGKADFINNVVTKKEADGNHPSSHYLVVEDPQKPSTWHLRYKDINGKVDPRLLGAAWAALHEGYRGNKYEGPNKQEAIDKLRALYKSIGRKVPSQLKERGYENNTKNKPNQNKENKMNREEKIKAIIANGNFGEDDKGFLDSLEDAQLDKIFQMIPKQNEENQDDEEKKKENQESQDEENQDDEKKKENEQSKEEEENKETVNNKEKKPATVEEFISQAPVEMQEVLTNSLNLLRDKKQKLIDSIKANKRNKFTDEQLNVKSLDELSALADLANIQVDYSGKAPVANQQKVEPLAIPDYGFSNNK